MKKIITIIGARPQFIKHAALQLEMQKHFKTVTIHTGQHYDKNMSAVFFNELKIPLPEYKFRLKNAKSHAEQTAKMLVDIEKVCLQEKPDAMLLYGDTNSTLAGCLVAAKLSIPQIHIEAGLRSFNRDMPEEINRIITDEFAYMLFCPTKTSIANLKREGIKSDKIYFCGDVMADTLHLVLPFTKKFIESPYYFATIHRPYNTDNKQQLKSIIEELNSLDAKVIFSIHPRTKQKIENFKIKLENKKNIKVINPCSYIDSISYQKNALAVITDSGGIQKEAYILKKKCITIRKETEWVETLIGNCNKLMFHPTASEIVEFLNIRPQFNTKMFQINSAKRIVDAIKSNL